MNCGYYAGDTVLTIMSLDDGLLEEDAPFFEVSAWVPLKGS